MTSPMPNPFVTIAEPSGFLLDERAFMAALLSNSVVADRAAARQPLRASSLDLAAVPSGAAALSNSNPSPRADDVTAVGLAVAPIRTASAAVTTHLDLNAKNIATLLSLAESDTASAETSSTLVKA